MPAPVIVRRAVLLGFLGLFGPLGLMAGSTDSTHLYRVLMLRAAPGELLNVIDLYKQHLPAYDAAHQPRPFIMRHSQGDQWDLLLLFPMTADRVTPDDEGFTAQVGAHIAWREDAFVARSEEHTAEIPALTYLAH